MGLSRADAERLGIGHLFPKGPRAAIKASRDALIRGAGKTLRAWSLAPAYDGCATSWTVEIPGWTPPSVNDLLRRHWASRRRVKRAAVETVAYHCRLADVRVATRRRRVEIEVTVANASHAFDGDNIPKAILDGLRDCEAIVDDNAEWCEQTPPVVVVGSEKRTVIRLADIGPLEA